MDKLTIYFDRNFGRRLPGALSKLRAPFEVRYHQGERFLGGMPDDEWLSIVGAKKWIVITQDEKFHLIDNEAEAIRQHNIKCFYFPGANEGLWETMCYFARFHSKLIELSNNNSTPFIYKFQKNGVVRKILQGA